MPDHQVASDLTVAAVAELYAGDPEAFTARRAELAAAARAAGDRAAARAIGALRRPTRAAWVANRLARAEPTAAERLAEFGDALLAAQRAGDGARLRELSATRGPLLDALAAAAFEAAGLTDPPTGLRTEVLSTLAAAVADPSVAAEFAAGTLTKGAEWAGFGGPPDDSAGVGAGSAAAERAPASSPVVEFARRPSRGQPREAAADRQPATAVRERRAEAEAKRLAAEAAEVAERAARQRLAFEESERVVAAASAATAEASAAEERLEREVRDFEERLTTARADLAAARMRARRAEAAERRARLAHERLAPP